MTSTHRSACMGRRARAHRSLPEEETIGRARRRPPHLLPRRSRLLTPPPLQEHKNQNSPQLLILAAAALLCLCAQLPTALAASALVTCPPPGFDSITGVDLPRFISSGPWYALEQNEVFYQRKDSLYCVRALYTPRDASDLSRGVVVRNTARRGSVTGPEVGSSASGGGFSGIVAFPDATAPKGPTSASKLRVLPSFLEAAYRLNPSSSLVSGPYWIVAQAPDLSWALISGGPPTNVSGGACRTGRAGAQTFLDINGSGLWIFARDPIQGASQMVTEARAAAVKLGYDVSTLLPVQHAGCVYPAAA